MVINLGISSNFGATDFEHLTFPTVMYVNYVKVYQSPDNVNMGCDPDDFPTQACINRWVSLPAPLCRIRFSDAYTDPNSTT